MTLTFTHAGRTITLSKHPRVMAQLRAGQITDAQASATPWYLRMTIGGKRKVFSLTSNNKLAIADARDKLNGQVHQPDAFSAWCAARETRRSITLGDLAQQWIAAGCPHDDASARAVAAASRLADTIRRALDFWATIRVAGVTLKTMNEFAGHRRATARTGATGDRTIDTQLSALSCLCEWAVLTERIEHNPFAKRKHFQDATTIAHCSDYMPDNDDQLHALLRWCWENREDESIGGALAFMALSGLRPGEVHLLKNLPPWEQIPENLAALQPGQLYPMPDGTRRLAVARLKGGQNPAIVVHSALGDFLRTWKATRPENQAMLFPCTQEHVAEAIAAAARALGLHEMHPHGMRAYYVRVRRSQGADDAQIALELGHSSNGKLIRNVYGEPRDPIGGNLHDWQPADKTPAWGILLTRAAANSSNAGNVRYSMQWSRVMESLTIPSRCKN